MRYLFSSLIAVSFSLVWPATAVDIQVSYDGVPAAAQSDFEQAAKIWSECLESAAPIKIHVSWISRGPTGFAQTNGVRNKPYLPRRDVWYPTALGHALNGARTDSADDMNIFLKDSPNWYFSQDRPIEEGEVDFINVALHEIAHGLGISSGSFTPWQGEPISSLGLPNDYVGFFDLTFERYPLDGTPTLYDSFLKLADDRTLMDFENPSRELTYALANPSLHFDGDHARHANLGFPVSVTPLNVSHIPQFPRRASPIMLADSGKGETRHAPDAILLGMLQDLGWTISEACQKGAP